MRRYFGRSRYGRRPNNRQLLLVLAVVVILFVLLNNRGGCSTVRAEPVGCDRPGAPLNPND
jgi:hypothetical protein